MHCVSTCAITPLLLVIGPDTFSAPSRYILVPAIRKLRITRVIRNAAERGMFRNKRPPEYPGGGLFGEVPERSRAIWSLQRAMAR
jgi:hypothetical protein